MAEGGKSGLKGWTGSWSQQTDYGPSVQASGGAARLRPSWEMTPDWQGKGQTVSGLKGSSVRALLTCGGSLATCRSCVWWKQTSRYGGVLGGNMAADMWDRNLIKSFNEWQRKERIRGKVEVLLFGKKDIWLRSLQPRSSPTRVFFSPQWAPGFSLLTVKLFWGWYRCKGISFSTNIILWPWAVIVDQASD